MNIVNNNETIVNIKIKKILNTLFILSIASIFIALIIVALSVNNSPLPDFPFSMNEYMWKFFLLTPIPLLSIILGIVFNIKGYKCKKNIIAGIIILILLIIYGSFTNIFKDSIKHDLSYLDDLSSEINIDFPNDAYISVTYDYMPNVDSIAMVKFYNNESFENSICNSGLWSEMHTLPSHLTDQFLRSLTINYDYYLFYNVNSDSFDILGNKLIYLSYDLETDTLFICRYK